MFLDTPIMLAASAATLNNGLGSTFWPPWFGKKPHACLCFYEKLWGSDTQHSLAFKRVMKPGCTMAEFKLRLRLRQTAALLLS